MEDYRLICGILPFNITKDDKSISFVKVPQEASPFTGDRLTI